MHNQSAEKPAPDAGSMAAAIAASAQGLQGRDLETALMDASMFGQLAYNAFCTLGFEKLDPPKLTREEHALVYWATTQLLSMVDEAKAAFYESKAKERASP